MNKRPTAKPTTENVFHYFEAVTVVLVYRESKIVERHLGGLNEAARKALEILSVSPTIFTTPRNSGVLALGSAK